MIACALAGPAAANEEPLVFDFEDGVQGWNLWFENIRREQADVLGGDFAIFGIDSGRMAIELDMTGVEEVTLEQRWNLPIQPRNLVYLILGQVDENGRITRIRVVGEGESLLTADGDPPADPDLRLFDVSGFRGKTTVSILWNAYACLPDDPCFATHFHGWVDNVSFHPSPVPEPSRRIAAIAALLALGCLRSSRARSRARHPPRSG